MCQSRLGESQTHSLVNGASPFLLIDKFSGSRKQVIFVRGVVENSPPPVLKRVRARELRMESRAAKKEPGEERVCFLLS
jgi:hypothetical protein